MKDEISEIDEKKQINLRRELEILSQIEHVSIIKFIGYSLSNFKQKERPVLISEILPNGSLADVIELESHKCRIDGWNNTKKLINIYILLIFSIEI